MEIKPMWELRQKQSLPLEAKIIMAKQRISDWLEWCYANGKETYVSFSGGLDSTVLLHLAREVDPTIEAIFCNTGLENTRIVDFVKKCENTTIIRPQMNFIEVINKYGYPLISKEVAECIEQGRASMLNGKYTYRIEKLNGTVLNKQGGLSIYNKAKYKPLLDAPFKISSNCCNKMKKQPFAKLKKYPIVGTMAEESQSRETAWRKTGCNAFESKKPKSQPLSFWLRQDILHYIDDKGIDYCEGAYGEIVQPIQSFFENKDCKLMTTLCQRTGCEFCLFGAHCKDDKRFLLLKESNRKRYDFILGGGQFDEKGLWTVSSKGLGYWYIFEWMGKELNIKYKY